MAVRVHKISFKKSDTASRGIPNTASYEARKRCLAEACMHLRKCIHQRKRSLECWSDSIM